MGPIGLSVVTRDRLQRPVLKRRSAQAHLHDEVTAEGGEARHRRVVLPTVLRTDGAVGVCNAAIPACVAAVEGRAGVEEVQRPSGLPALTTVSLGAWRVPRDLSTGAGTIHPYHRGCACDTLTVVAPSPLRCGWPYGDTLTHSIRNACRRVKSSSYPLGHLNSVGHLLWRTGVAPGIPAVLAVGGERRANRSRRAGRVVDGPTVWLLWREPPRLADRSSRRVALAVIGR